MCEANEIYKNAERYFLVQGLKQSILDTISQDFIKKKKKKKLHNIMSNTVFVIISALMEVLYSISISTNHYIDLIKIREMILYSIFCLYLSLL